MPRVQGQADSRIAVAQSGQRSLRRAPLSIRFSFYQGCTPGTTPRRGMLVLASNLSLLLLLVLRVQYSVLL